MFVGLSRVRKRLVLNLPPCHVTAVQQQAADGQLTARGVSLTLPGATYPICLAFALINALAKRQASNVMVASKHVMNLHKTAITQCLDSGMGFTDTQNDEGLGACFSEKYIIHSLI